MVMLFNEPCDVAAIQIILATGLRDLDYLLSLTSHPKEVKILLEEKSRGRSKTTEMPSRPLHVKLGKLTPRDFDSQPWQDKVSIKQCFSIRRGPVPSPPLSP
jgi:hypothetical protein